MKTISLPLLCLLLVSVFAVGQQAPALESDSHVLASTGAGFLRVCDRPDSGHESGHIRALCMAYVAGVADGATLLAIRKLDWLPFCLTPDAVSKSAADNGHLFAAVLGYLKAHPEKTDSQTRALVVDALIATFPCAPHK
jgi:hypothetical protein